MTTLADGSLLMMFKRPADASAPVEIERGDDVSIGMYL